MSVSTPEEVRAHVKTYMKVFGALAILTIVTVAVSYLHLSSVFIAVGLAVAIASLKGSLVAGYFMHLFGERKIVYWVLVLCAIFLFMLLFVPTWIQGDSVEIR